MRRRHLLALAVLGLVIPAAVVLVGYPLFLQSTAYVAEAKLALRGGDPSSMVARAAGSPDLVHPDLAPIRRFVHSASAVTQLGSRLDLRAVYGKPTIDWYQRLPAGAGDRALLDHVQGMIEPTVDSASGVVTLRVRAFSAADAAQIAQNLVQLTRAAVDQASAAQRQALLAMGHAAVAHAERRIATARKAMQAQRRRLGLDDGAATAADREQDGAGLAERLGHERAALMDLRAYLREDNARIAASKARIAALSAEIARAGADRGIGSEARATDDRESLALELEFAMAAHQSALRGLEALRADAWRQDRRLVVVVPPEVTTGSWAAGTAGRLLTIGGALSTLTVATLMTVALWRQVRGAILGTGSWAFASPSV